MKEKKIFKKCVLFPCSSGKVWLKAAEGGPGGQPETQGSVVKAAEEARRTASE